jgi:hypothetical protein
MSEAIVFGILLIVLLIERTNLTSLCSRTYCDPNVPVPYCLGFTTGRVFRCAVFCRRHRGGFDCGCAGQSLCIGDFAFEFAT